MFFPFGGAWAGERRRLETAPFVQHLEADLAVFLPQPHPLLIDAGVPIHVGQSFLEDAVERDLDRQ